MFQKLVEGQANGNDNSVSLLALLVRKDQARFHFLGVREREVEPPPPLWFCAALEQGLVLGGDAPQELRKQQHRAGRQAWASWRADGCRSGSQGSYGGMSLAWAWAQEKTKGPRARSSALPAWMIVLQTDWFFFFFGKQSLHVTN